MKDTYFYLPDAKKDRLVALYSEDKDKKLVKTATLKSLPTDPDFPIVGAKSYFSGGGGLSSTAYDYAIFLQMLLNNGVYNGKRLLSRKALSCSQMQTKPVHCFPIPIIILVWAFRLLVKPDEQKTWQRRDVCLGWRFQHALFCRSQRKNLRGTDEANVGNNLRSELDRKFDVLVFQAQDD